MVSFMTEIFKLKLCCLVVLSACQTGLGKLIGKVWSVLPGIMYAELLVVVYGVFQICPPLF
jgi:hypothetical protein